MSIIYVPGSFALSLVIETKLSNPYNQPPGRTTQGIITAPAVFAGERELITPPKSDSFVGKLEIHCAV